MTAFSSLLGVGFFCFFATAFGKEAEIKVELPLWTRGKGLYANDESLPKKDLRKIMVTSASRQTLKDIQYGGKSQVYAGAMLEDILKQYPKPPQVDLALLHFENGMIVPFPLENGDAPKVFIAVALVEKDKLLPQFPPVERPHREEVSDPRPIQFLQNKIVVSSPFHPMAHKKGQGDFTPWRYVDSLKGIEFVNEGKYYGQFASDSSQDSMKGMTVFKERCQYCHGVRKIGAKLGWDFVEPLAVYKMKQPQNIYFHVAVPKMNAVERGLLMPAQKDITQAEAKSMWSWMKLQAEKKQNPYP